MVLRHECHEQDGGRLRASPPYPPRLRGRVGWGFASVTVSGNPAMAFWPGAAGHSSPGPTPPTLPSPPAGEGRWRRIQRMHHASAEKLRNGPLRTLPHGGAYGGAGVL